MKEYVGLQLGVRLFCSGLAFALVSGSWGFELTREGDRGRRLSFLGWWTCRQLSSLVGGLPTRLLGNICGRGRWQCSGSTINFLFMSGRSSRKLQSSSTSSPSWCGLDSSSSSSGCCRHFRKSLAWPLPESSWCHPSGSGGWELGGCSRPLRAVSIFSGNASVIFLEAPIRGLADCLARGAFSGWEGLGGHG